MSMQKMLAGAASHYSFGDSASNATQANINNTMDAIKNTLEEIQQTIDILKPEWVASEADTYYGIIEQWKTGAHDIASVLEQVKTALNQVHTGNANLRAGITQILAETS